MANTTAPDAKETAAYTDQSFRIPTVEDGKDINELYAKYTNATGWEKTTFKTSIFEKHKFAKLARPLEMNIDGYAFKAIGYSLDVWGFKKWLQKDPTGKKYKKTAGGVSDDGLYTLSPLLRELLPRGFHHVTVTDKQGQCLASVEFTGIPKFTGLTAGDEDEESNSSQANFFFNGAKLSDAKTFYRTEKSNGENAKCRVIQVKDSFYFLAGSKNTCLAWPAYKPSTEYYSCANKTLPGPFVAKAVSEWFLALDKAKQQAFLEGAVEYGSMMGEINLECHEHIFPIKETYIEFYSVLDKITARPIHPKQAFGFFTKHTLQCVKHSEHPFAELDAQVNDIRDTKGTEGAVLYVLGENDAVLGLIKIKASSYVIWRRIRETFRSTIVNPIQRNLVIGIDGPKKPKQGQKANSISIEDLTSKSCGRIGRGMSTLHHVPGCKEHHQEWSVMGRGFIKWWMNLVKTDNTMSVEQRIIQANDKFGTLYHQYLASEEGKAVDKK